MSALLHLTWRYITFHKVKSLLLLVALALTCFLPVAAGALVRFYEQDLTRRADATPLVIGNKGDRFDLVLKALYFTGEAPEAMTMAEFDTLQESERAALLLENELIRTLRPRHNVDGAFHFLYPALGTAVRGHQSLFCLTTDVAPWEDLALWQRIRAGRGSTRRLRTPSSSWTCLCAACAPGAAPALSSGAASTRRAARTPRPGRGPRSRG